MNKALVWVAIITLLIVALVFVNKECERQHEIALLKINGALLGPNTESPRTPIGFKK